MDARSLSENPVLGFHGEGFLSKSLDRSASKFVATEMLPSFFLFRSHTEVTNASKILIFGFSICLLSVTVGPFTPVEIDGQLMERRYVEDRLELIHPISEQPQAPSGNFTSLGTAGVRLLCRIVGIGLSDLLQLSQNYGAYVVMSTIGLSFIGPSRQAISESRFGSSRKASA
jgi:hypothetical protein